MGKMGAHGLLGIESIGDFVSCLNLQPPDSTVWSVPANILGDRDLTQLARVAEVRCMPALFRKAVARLSVATLMAVGKPRGRHNTIRGNVTLIDFAGVKYKTYYFYKSLFTVSALELTRVS